MKKRIEWVDYAKGMSILLVVIHHSIFRDSSINLHSEELVYLNDLFRYFRMPLFFFIAGLFIHKALSSKLSVFLKDKIGNFLYIFVLWSVIHYLIKTVAPYLILGSETDLKSILSIFIYPPNTLWFIYALLIFFLITRLTKKIPYIALAIAMMFFIFTINNADSLESTILIRVARFYPYFLLGYIFADFVKLAADKVRIYHSILILPYFSIMVFFFEESWANSSIAVFLLGLLGIMSGIIIAVILSKITIFSWLGYIGKNTLSIYLMHTIPLFVLKEVFKVIIPNQPLLATLLLVLIGVMLSLLFGTIFKKLKMNWLLVPPFTSQRRSDFKKVA